MAVFKAFCKNNFILHEMHLLLQTSEKCGMSPKLMSKVTGVCTCVKTTYRLSAERSFVGGSGNLSFDIAAQSIGFLGVLVALR